MDGNTKKCLLCILIVLLLQSCGISRPSGNSHDWVTPLITHSIELPESISIEIMWEKQAYVLSSGLKNVQCVATKDAIVLAGSPNSNTESTIFALDAKSGSELWSFDHLGVIANSSDGIYIGTGMSVYLIESETGIVKWKKKLVGIRNITGMMVDNDEVFINGTGIFNFYVLNNRGETVSKHTQVSEFRSKYNRIPFYPTLPFGTEFGENTYIVQTGDALYSAFVYDKSTSGSVGMSVAIVG